MSKTFDEVRAEYGIRLYGAVSLHQFSYERPVAMWGNNLCVQVTMGAFSYMNANSVWRNVDIGRYSSLGDGAGVGLGNHRPSWVGTSPFMYAENDCFRTMTSYSELPEPIQIPKPQSWFPEKTTIGNDVWFGSGVTITGSRPISISNGAVVAAKSVVTKDVPSYAVVAGNPAKIVKYRFSDELCADLAATKWWDYDWMAFGNSRKDQWFAAPFDDPARFIEWWNEEGHNAIRQFTIQQHWYDVESANKNFQLSRRTDAPQHLQEGN